ncbi:unnamed protein product [Schistosoma margrebowiei]|uniref:CBS domain-containing protein n=1 Tax=Schistosoma margrebowiei TaxID=48269 RepID=A0A3P8CMI4_9TREM|nr:unnamed protein product [Schistosoma margrebowiei]
MIEPEKSSYYVFLKYHTCYDLLPESAKLVVLDTKLSIKKAFYALIYNNVRAAILWDSSKQSYSGILTITDFIKVLVTLYPPDSGKMDEFEESSISSWRGESVYYFVLSHFGNLFDLHGMIILETSISYILELCTDLYNKSVTVLEKQFFHFIAQSTAHV